MLADIYSVTEDDELQYRDILNDIEDLEWEGKLEIELVR
jgi:hypothetical protein